MATRYDLLPYLEGNGTIDNPLTNIPELALAQQKKRGDWLEKLGEWKVGDVEVGRRIGNILVGGLQTFDRNILNWSGTALSALGRVSEGIFGGESSLKNAGTYLLDLDQEFDKAAQQAHYDVNHGNIDKLAEDWHGSGTSLGFATTQLLTWLATLGTIPPSAMAPGLRRAIAIGLAYIARNTHEALSEAGNAVSDLYAMDKNRLDDALKGGLYSMLGNVPLDMAQGGIEGIAGAIGKPILDNVIPGSGVVSDLIKSYIGGLIGQEANELAQEPRQQFTEQAVKNTFKSGDMSLSNFWDNYTTEASKFPEYFKQVAPSVASSTFITHNLTFPFGVAGGAYHTNRYNRAMRTEVPQAVSNLEAQRANLEKQRTTMLNNAEMLDKQHTDLLNNPSNAYQSGNDSGLGINPSNEDMDTNPDYQNDVQNNEAERLSIAENMRSQAERMRSQAEDLLKNTKGIDEQLKLLKDYAENKPSWWEADAPQELFDALGKGEDGISLFPDDEGLKEDNTNTPEPSDNLPDEGNYTGQPDVAPDEDNRTQRLVDDEPDIDLEEDKDYDTSTQEQQTSPIQEQQGETFHQAAQNRDIDAGTFTFSTKGKSYTFGVAATDKNNTGTTGVAADRRMRYQGRRLALRNSRGQVIAAYYPHTGRLDIAPDIAKKHSARWLQSFKSQFMSNSSEYLGRGGFLDANGNLASDGNEAFRERWNKRMKSDKNSFYDDIAYPEDNTANGETLHQSNTAQANTFTVRTGKGNYSFKVRAGEFSNNHQKQKKYFGRFLELVDAAGKVIARYSPHLDPVSGKIQFEFSKHAPKDWATRNAIMSAVGNPANLNMMLANNGFVDQNGQLIDDTDKDFRQKELERRAKVYEAQDIAGWMKHDKAERERRAKMSFGERMKEDIIDDTIDSIKGIPDNVKRRYRKGKANLLRAAYTGRSVVYRAIQYMSDLLDSKEGRKLREKIRDKLNDAGVYNKEQNDALSRVIAAQFMYLASYTGKSAEELLEDYFFDIVADLSPTGGFERDSKTGEIKRNRFGNYQESRGTYRPIEAGEPDQYGNVVDHARNLIYLYRGHDVSTMIHEPAHFFLNVLHDLYRNGQLSGRAKQDWDTLVKYLGLEGVDLTKPITDPKNGTGKNGTGLKETDPEGYNKWHDAQEKFATSAEKYIMNGKAPKLKLARAFEILKRYMGNVYSAVGTIQTDEFGMPLRFDEDGKPHVTTVDEAIQYTGMDEQEHAYTMSDEAIKLMGILYSGKQKTVRKGKGSSESTSGTGETYHQPLNRDVNDVGGNPYLGDGETYHQTAPKRIRRSNDSFITQQDIERFEQLVYHGTGHIILGNKFSLKYLGSGEGAQVFGWGLYFAENPDVSEHYRDFGLNDINVTLNNGETITVDKNANYTNKVSPVLAKILRDIQMGHRFYPDMQAQRLLKSLEEAIRIRISDGEFGFRFFLGKEISPKEELKVFQTISNVEFLPKRGNINNIDIPENDILLDLDVSFENQSEKVKKAWQETISRVKQLGGSISRLQNAKTGLEFQKALVHVMLKHLLKLERKNQTFSINGVEINDEGQAASLILNQAGIPGLRYLDGFSRGKGEGTHNFVIWNTDMMQVLGLTPDSDTDAIEYFERTKKLRDGLATADIEAYHQVIRSADDLDYSLKIAQSQLDAVRRKYEGTEAWLKAPNGKPSNLTEKQWLQVRTPNFKLWFGDWENNPQNASKILDENGEPLVVWHGTPKGSFNTFDVSGEGMSGGTGAWFALNKNVASTYMKSSPTGKVYAVFLNIRNPYILNAQGKGWNELIKFGRKAITTDDIVKGVWRGTLGSGNNDGVIIKNVVDPYVVTDEYILRIPENIKSATHNNGKFARIEGNIYHQATRRADDFTLTPQAQKQMAEIRAKYEGTDAWLKAPNGKKSNLTERQWLAVRTPLFKAWFGDWENDPTHASKVLDENGEPKVVYHGTARADRVGSVFDPKRATSGPMAFFTDSREIAEGYSRSKKDTSLSREGMDKYENWFSVEAKSRNGKGENTNIIDYWYTLTPKEQARIAAIAPTIGYNDNYKIASISGNSSGLGGYEQHLHKARGNHFAALVDEWLNSGTLFNDEYNFLSVLHLVGFDNVKYIDPYYREQAVYDTFMSLRNPFYTSNITNSDFQALRRSALAAERHFNPQKAFNSDDWDKTAISPMEWIARLEEDINNGTTYAWTQIPDFVTNRLKKLGYDGIVDEGGKYHDDKHTVYIPFASGQIKSSSKNNGEYSHLRDIYHQPQISKADLRITSTPAGFISDKEIYNQRTYHATGHIIKNNQFSTDYAFTGGGWHARGYGIYSSELKSSAEPYRTNGLKKEDRYTNIYEFTLKGGRKVRNAPDVLSWTDGSQTWDRNSQEGKLWSFLYGQLEYLDNHNDAPSALRDALDEYASRLEHRIENSRRILDELKGKPENTRNIIRRNAANHLIKEAQADLDFARKNAPTYAEYIKPKKGNIYAVESPENFQILDWDKDIHENSQQVQNILRSIIKNFDRLHITGGELYRHIARRLGSEKKASMWLMKQGIPALMYLDKASRENGGNSHNFVTWDTRLLHLLGVDGDIEAVEYFREYRDALENADPDKIDFGSLTQGNRGFISDETVERYHQDSLHGTGHTIEENRMQLSKVGSGEGGMFRGWGVYSAQARGVAEAYRRYGLPQYPTGRKTFLMTFKDGSVLDFNNYLLTTRDKEVREIYRTISALLGTTDTIPDSQSIIDYLRNYFSNMLNEHLDSIKSMEKDIERAEQTGRTRTAEELRKALDNAKPYIPIIQNTLQTIDNIADFQISPAPKGNIYRLDVPENDIILNWDAALRNQPKHVRQAIEKIKDFIHRQGDIYRIDTGNINDAKSGGALYMEIVDVMQRYLARYTPDDGVTDAKKRTSLLFNRFGVPGLRFLDHFSRAPQAGRKKTYNFVTWNEDYIKVLGIDPDSDKNAIEYFERYRAEHPSLQRR